MKQLNLFSAGTFCQVELQSPCHPVNRAANLEACLAAIGNMATDPSHFWFGNQYLIDCPPARQDNINCSTYLTGFPYTLAQRLFKEDTTDLSTLDRYLNVKYTSPPGNKHLFYFSLIKSSPGLIIHLVFLTMYTKVELN